MLVFIVFASLPEALGDWPYNVFGPEHAKAHPFSVHR